MIISKKIYLHGDKDYMFELGEELGLSEAAMNTFKNELSEVELDVVISKETGKIEICGINGEQLI